MTTGRAAALFCALMIAGCAPGEPGETEAPPDVERISDRVVLYMEASAEALQAARADFAEDDFYAVADDLMWYRAEAYDFFEERGQAVRRFDGRRPFAFRVRGEWVRFDFEDFPWLDLVVLYDPERDPLVIPPIDAHGATVYFEGG